MEIYKKMGKRIRDERNRKGISQETLAEMCNLGTSYIGIIERAEKRASIGTLVKIANALKVSIDCLLGDSIKYSNDTLVEKAAGYLKDLNEDEANYVYRIIEDSRDYFKKKKDEN